MNAGWITISALPLLLLAPVSGRTSPPQERRDITHLPASRVAGARPSSTADERPRDAIYDNTRGSSSFYYAGQSGAEAIDDLHGVTSGTMTSFSFEYVEPDSFGAVTFSAFVRFYRNPGGADKDMIPLFGPYVVRNLPLGHHRIDVPVADGSVIGPDLWMGVRFSSPTAGLVVHDEPWLGESHDFYVENQNFYYFGGHPRANFSLRIGIEARSRADPIPITWAKLKETYAP